MEDEERQGLLSPSAIPSSGGAGQDTTSDFDGAADNRDQKAVDAVENLYLVVVVTAITMFLTLCVEVINCFTANAIPLWVMFMFLWMGHFAIGVVVFQSVKYMLQSMISKNNRERFSQKWHQANERRIPVVQFVVYHVAWILGISFSLICGEIIVYLAVTNTVPMYAAFIIPYFIIGIALSNSLVCRYNPLHCICEC
jgi:heme/copper-type cytochrome/quinol oxidase subunit 2